MEDLQLREEAKDAASPLQKYYDRQQDKFILYTILQRHYKQNRLIE